MKAVFVDIETTGLDFISNVPLDVAVVIVDLNTHDEMHKYTSCITCDAKHWEWADPKALEINGYSKETFPECAKPAWQVGSEIKKFLVDHEIVKGRAFFICQNPAFDRPFFLQLLSQYEMNELNMPYHCLDLASMYWIKYHGSFWPIPSLNSPYKDFCYELSLTKDSIAASFGIPPEPKPHKAMKGVEHLIACYEAIASSRIPYNHCHEAKASNHFIDTLHSKKCFL